MFAVVAIVGLHLVLRVLMCSSFSRSSLFKLIVYDADNVCDCILMISIDGGSHNSLALLMQLDLEKGMMDCLYAKCEFSLKISC